MPTSDRLSDTELDEILSGTAVTTDVTARPAGEDTAAADGQGGTARLLVRARAHPVIASTAVVVVALAGAGVVAAVHRPPPVGTDVGAVAMLNTIDYRTEDAFEVGDLVRVELVVRPRPPVSRIQVDGLVGPGLSSTTVDADGTRATVVGPLACADVPSLDQAPTYRVRVSRTDDYGRDITQDVPIEGADGAGLGMRVAETCLQRAARALQVREMTLADDAGAVGVTVLNPTDRPLHLLGLLVGRRRNALAFRVTGTAPAALPAQTTATLVVRSLGEACPRHPATLPLRLWLAVAGGIDGGPYLGGGAPAGIVDLPLSPAQRDLLSTAAGASCDAGTGRAA